MNPTFNSSRFILKVLINLYFTALKGGYLNKPVDIFNKAAATVDHIQFGYLIEDSISGNHGISVTFYDNGFVYKATLTHEGVYDIVEGDKIRFLQLASLYLDRLASIKLGAMV